MKETLATFNPDVTGITVTSIALDAKGQPRIAYADAKGTYYARRDASGWHVTRIAAWAKDIRLVIDGQGHPRLALAMGGEGLWYLTKSGGSWHRQQLDANPVKALGGIALGPHGQTNVVYQRGVELQRALVHPLDLTQAPTCRRLGAPGFTSKCRSAARERGPVPARMSAT